MNKIAINHKTALRMGFDYGIVNELNLSDIYNRMKLVIKQPSHGYFYANDVDDFYGDELIKLLNN
jgi:hypothetical protein